jgi:hypothetical protein
MFAPPVTFGNAEQACESAQMADAGPRASSSFAHVASSPAAMGFACAHVASECAAMPFDCAAVRFRRASMASARAHVASRRAHVRQRVPSLACELAHVAHSVAHAAFCSLMRRSSRRDSQLARLTLVSDLLRCRAGDPSSDARHLTRRNSRMRSSSSQHTKPYGALTSSLDQFA